MNFIQYIDDSYRLKVKQLSDTRDSEEGFLIKGIDTPYFIVSLFIDSKRVENVNMFQYESLYMLSVINDLSTIDLNTIPLNHFAPAYTEIYLRYGEAFTKVLVMNETSANGSQNQFNPLIPKVLHYSPTDKYGVIYPTITTKDNFNIYDYRFFPYELNVKKFIISYDATDGIYTLDVMHNLLYDEGDYESMTNTLIRYHPQELNAYPQSIFRVDDLYLKVVENSSLENWYFEFTIYPTYNFVVLTDRSLPLQYIECNFNNTSTTYMRFMDPVNNFKQFTLVMDWKQMPSFIGS